MGASVRRAGPGDLDALASLFDGYRRFYRQPSDVSGARDFLAARLEKEDSIILIAEEEGRALGFTQLFPSHSSVSMRRTFILNDLYVDPEARGTRVASALLDAAVAHGREAGAKSLTLQTEHTNEHAQAVYEAKGWVAESEFKTYRYRLDA